MEDLVRTESRDSARFQYLVVDWISTDDESMYTHLKGPNMARGGE